MKTLRIIKIYEKEVPDTLPIDNAMATARALLKDPYDVVGVETEDGGVEQLYLQQAHIGEKSGGGWSVYKVNRP